MKCLSQVKERLDFETIKADKSRNICKIGGDSVSAQFTNMVPHKGDGYKT